MSRAFSQAMTSVILEPVATDSLTEEMFFFFFRITQKDTLCSLVLSWVALFLDWEVDLNRQPLHLWLCLSVAPTVTTSPWSNCPSLWLWVIRYSWHASRLQAQCCLTSTPATSLDGEDSTVSLSISTGLSCKLPCISVVCQLEASHCLLRDINHMQKHRHGFLLRDYSVFWMFEIDCESRPWAIAVIKW